MTRYEAIEKALKDLIADFTFYCKLEESSRLIESAEAALALPEDSKVVNAELYGLETLAAALWQRYIIMTCCSHENGLWLPFARYEEHQESVRNAFRYLSLREASGEPMPYKVVREGDKVRFI